MRIRLAHARKRIGIRFIVQNKSVKNIENFQTKYWNLREKKIIKNLRTFAQNIEKSDKVKLQILRPQRDNFVDMIECVKTS